MLIDHRDVRRTTGQVLVEFALVVLPLCVILMGIIDFGYYFFEQITLNNATRLAVRKGSLNNKTNAQIKGICVSSAVGVPITSSNIRLTVRNADSFYPGSPPTLEAMTTRNHQFFSSGLLPLPNNGVIPVKANFRAIITTWTEQATPSFSGDP